MVLMGPPGAGKGTQAKRLADEFKLAHLSSGDIFRAEKASGSDLGKKLAQYMQAGQLVPDDIVVAMMAKAVGQAAMGLLLDGFPRTVPQAEALDAQLAKAGTPLDGIIVITADDNAIVERITGRRSCPKCGAVYHVKFLKSKAQGLCDKGCGALTQRDDDKEEVVRSRLEAYYRQTEPVITYYRGVSGLKMIEVDGNRSPDQVTAALFDAVRKLG